MQFPNVDPIPIPAPVWLMKTLGLLTLALHFFAVQILIGSLLAVCYFSYRGRKGELSYQTAAAVIARRLPIVMTYVINLGIPPLLFAQVLYGRALYTSSILIAVIWISVIFILMAVYWLLYRIAERTREGKPAALHAFVALLLAGGVGQIYSLNMTLMLRPEVWQNMYATTKMGLQTPPHDPTMMPRWLFVMVGGLLVGGLWLMLHSYIPNVGEGSKSILKKVGAGMTVVGAFAQLAVGPWVFAAQPENIQKALGSPLYLASAGIWGLGVVLTLLLAALQLGKAGSTVLTIITAVTAFLGIAGGVIFRDGIRDQTLLSKGFDVWKRTEASNWSVIGLFLLLFVIGLGTVGWLLLVMKKAQPISERVNS